MINDKSERTAVIAMFNEPSSNYSSRVPVSTSLATNRTPGLVRQSSRDTITLPRPDTIEFTLLAPTCMLNKYYHTHSFNHCDQHND